MSNVKFDVTDNERALIQRIVARYAAIEGRMIHTSERQWHEMDLAACHCNGTRLNLRWLLEEASDFELTHDIVGLYRHLDRKTGQIADQFLPRAARIKGRRK